MKSSNILIVSFFIVVSCTICNSQNYLMSSDQTGFHGSALLSTGTFEDALALSPGYTIDGRLTAGVDFGKAKDKINKLNSTVFRTHVSYLILKQNEENMPVSINLKAGYLINILPATAFNSSSWQLSSELYHEFAVQNDVKVIPHAGLLGNKPISINGTSNEEDISITTNAGLTVLWQNIYFDTGFLIGNGNRAFSLLVGYIL